MRERALLAAFTALVAVLATVGVRSVADLWPALAERERQALGLHTDNLFVAWEALTHANNPA
jgi:hypothetical protein